jgi:acetoin utilization deacetylase AcuC-like enzyme
MSTAEMSTAYVYHPLYLAHDLPGHPENARRLRRVMEMLEADERLARLHALDPRLATREELERVHSPALIERVRRTAEAGGGHLDADTYLAPRSYEAARMAAGGVIRAVEATLAGEVDNAFALVRPPGHHATATRAMGFCLFNNVAVAARAALATERVSRVFIADFDVHHGNGTQDIFRDDPRVWFFSTHQSPYYPGTGHWRETGRGAGQGSLLNVPLPSGVGDAGYARIYADLVWPWVERCDPDLILVSAGYDAHWRDPLAQMSLSLTGYAHLQRELVRMAETFCDGRIVFTLEGGYQLEVLAHGVRNAFYALLGEEPVSDPLGPAPGPEPNVEPLLSTLMRTHRLGREG